MDDRATVSLLNAILPRLSRSLAVYLADATPWIPPQRERLQVELAAMAADHREYGDRLAALILDLHGRIGLSGFPMEYSDLHDVSADFLLTRLICDTQANLAAVGRAVGRLDEGSPARQLLEEICGNLQGHLDILQGAAA
jgi:hypothetical protein